MIILRPELNLTCLYKKIGEFEKIGGETVELIVFRQLVYVGFNGVNDIDHIRDLLL